MTDQQTKTIDLDAEEAEFISIFEDYEKNILLLGEVAKQDAAIIQRMRDGMSRTFIGWAEGLPPERLKKIHELQERGVDLFYRKVEAIAQLDGLSSVTE